MRRYSNSDINWLLFTWQSQNAKQERCNLKCFNSWCCDKHHFWSTWMWIVRSSNSCWLVFRCSPRGSVLCVSSRWPHSFQQRRGFRKASRKPETKKVEEVQPPPTESSEAAIHRRTSTPHLDQQAPSSSPRAFGRLVRPFVFTVGVGVVYLSVSEVTSSARSQAGVNAMSVYRLLLRLSSHLAVWVSQVPSPELLERYESWLAGEAATSETRGRSQRGEDRRQGGEEEVVIDVK